MTLKKILLILLAIGAFVVCGFVFMLYLTLRTKTSDVSEQFPYSEIVGKSFETIYPLVLLEHNDQDHETDGYIMHYPGAQYSYNLVEKYALEPGVQMDIHSAKGFTNGVSGFTHYFLLGEVYVPEVGTKLPFRWQYGDRHFTLSDEGDYMTFGRAPWRAERMDKDFWLNGEKPPRKSEFDYYAFEDSLLNTYLP